MQETRKYFLLGTKIFISREKQINFPGKSQREKKQEN